MSPRHEHTLPRYAALLSTAAMGIALVALVPDFWRGTIMGSVAAANAIAYLWAGWSNAKLDAAELLDKTRKGLGATIQRERELSASKEREIKLWVEQVEHVRRETAERATKLEMDLKRETARADAAQVREAKLIRELNHLRQQSCLADVQQHTR